MILEKMGPYDRSVTLFTNLVVPESFPLFRLSKPQKKLTVKKKGATNFDLKKNAEKELTPILFFFLH